MILEYPPTHMDVSPSWNLFAHACWKTYQSSSRERQCPLITCVPVHAIMIHEIYYNYMYIYVHMCTVQVVLSVDHAKTLHGGSWDVFFDYCKGSMMRYRKQIQEGLTGFHITSLAVSWPQTTLFNGVVHMNRGLDEQNGAQKLHVPLVADGGSKMRPWTCQIFQGFVVQFGGETKQGVSILRNTHVFWRGFWNYHSDLMLEYMGYNLFGI